MRRRWLPLLAVLLALGAWMLWQGAPWPQASRTATRANDALLGALLPALVEALAQEQTATAAAPTLWDLSAVLTDAQGKRLGLRLGLAKVDLASEQTGPGGRSAALAAKALMAAGLALADAERGRWFFDSRASRTALGLAGVEPSAPDATTWPTLWVEDWRLTPVADGLQLEASIADGEIALLLQPTIAPIDARASGLLAGPEIGPGAGPETDPGTDQGAAASAVELLLQPGLQVSGSIRLAGGEARAVTGSAWLEQARGALAGLIDGGRGQLALNRFALMLDDGSALACVHLRRRQGGGTPIPTCLLIGAEGSERLYRRRDLTLTPAPRQRLAQGVYPLRWQLSLPEQALTLDLTPLLAAQGDGFSLAGDLWSGAVLVAGTRDGRPIRGSGRMDLGGYRGG